MPFWARTTFAPEAWIFSTMARRVFSSSSRNICSFAGSRIRISSLTSVFFTSRARLMRAIFASRTNFGMRGWTRSLSSTTPSIRVVSFRFPPCFFWTRMLSTSARTSPATSSTMDWTASTAMSARKSAFVPTLRPDMAVRAMDPSVALSVRFTSKASCRRRRTASAAAMRYPFTMIVGWTSCSIRDSASLRSSPARTTDLVVLRLRDFDEHLRGRVLDLDLLEDRDPVVRDRHVAEGVDEHLVHALRSQGRLDRVCDRARRGDVVVHRAFSLLALGPFLQDNDWLAAHHENSRGSIRGLLYECFASQGLPGPASLSR